MKLFVFYYVTPLLKELDVYKDSHKTWQLFNEKISVMKRQIKNKEIDSEILQNFVNPIQKELDQFNINIVLSAFYK